MVRFLFENGDGMRDFRPCAIAVSLLIVDFALSLIESRIDNWSFLLASLTTDASAVRMPLGMPAVRRLELLPRYCKDLASQVEDSYRARLSATLWERRRNIL